jgi:hypothetical protein
LRSISDLISNLRRSSFDELFRPRWDAVTAEQLMEVLSTMPERMQDIIVANGGRTKWWSN